MIIVKLQGGLGNQMFQYAIGRRLSLYYDAGLKLDSSIYIRDDGRLTPRQYALDVFHVKPDFASEKTVSIFKPSQNYIARLYKFITRAKYYKEKGFLFDPGYLAYGKNAYLDGYWQSERYFIEIENIIRKDLSFHMPLNETNREMLEQIRSTQSVSIHIRRGDYVNNPDTNAFHGVCTNAYYEKAVELIAKKVEQPHFFVFSDDIGWVQKNFTISYPLTIVDVNKGMNGEHDMHLMSTCKHNIIANSSFSWWAAWLNNNKDKIVTGPEKWFTDPSIDTSTIMPESWYKL